MHLLDNIGQQQREQLHDALYMPHNILSVAAAANGGATIAFKKEDGHTITKDSSEFDIH